MKAYRLIPFFVFCVALGTYLFTLTPTVDFIDSGEFAAVASTLGIAHPTGYPLYTLLGHLCSKIPLASRVIFRLNILSSLLAALAAGIFTLFIKNFLSISGPAKTEASDDLREKLEWLAALAAGLILVWSRVFWEIGTTLEVYSLHAFFIALLFYLLSRYLLADDERKEKRLGALFFLILGLSLANHLTTILLLPAFALLCILKWKERNLSFGKMLLIMLPLLIGLSLYLYLPLRASHNPEVMWGKPSTLEGLWNHISVSDFRHRIKTIPEPGDTPGGYLARLFRTLTGEMDGDSLREFFALLLRRLGYAVLPFIILGIVEIFRRSRRYFYFLLLAFIPATFYAATYDVPDNIFYYNPSYMVLVAVAAAGILGVFLWLARRGGGRVAAIILIPALALPPLFINYSDVNKKNNYFTEDFIRNLFSTIEPNAILFALDVHIFIHPLDYYQRVEGLRTDVVVLPNHGLQKGWFGEQLKYHHPEIYEKSAREIEAYRDYLDKIENGEAYDYALLERLYCEMLSSIISRNYDRRPIYVTSEFDHAQKGDYHPGFRKAPEGLAWRLLKAGDSARDFPYREFSYRELSYPHKDADAIRHAYMYMLMEKANCEESKGNIPAAKKWLEQALRVYPGDELVSDTYNGKVVVRNRHRDLLHRYALLLGKEGDFEKARAVAANLIEFAPDDPRGYAVGGIMLVREGRLEEARDLFRRGLGRIPGDPLLLQNLRTVEGQIGNP